MAILQHHLSIYPPCVCEVLNHPNTQVELGTLDIQSITPRHMYHQTNYALDEIYKFIRCGEKLSIRKTAAVNH